MSSRLSATPDTLSVGNWVVTFIILAIPLVNIGAIFYWAFGGSVNPNKRTYAQASLIMFGIGVALYLLIFVGLGVSTTLLEPT